jgi:hypothetical protein
MQYTVDVNIGNNVNTSGTHVLTVEDISEEQLEVKNQHIFSFKTSKNTGIMNDIVGGINSPNDALIRATIKILGELLFPVYNENDIHYGKVADLWSPTTTSILYNAVHTYVDNHPFLSEPVLLIRMFIRGMDLSGVHVGTFLTFRVEYISTLPLLYQPTYIYQTPEQYMIKILCQCTYILDKLHILIQQTNIFKNAFDMFIGYTDTLVYPNTGWGHSTEPNAWEGMLVQNKSRISEFLASNLITGISGQHTLNDLASISMRISIFINWIYIDLDSSLNIFPIYVQNYMFRNRDVCRTYFNDIKLQYAPMYLLSSTTGRIISAFCIEENTVLGWESYMFAYGQKSR